MTITDEQRTDVEQRRPSDRWVLLLAALSSIAVLISNVSGIAIGDDGVGYRATADSLLAGDGLQYFLEHPLTVWPPTWPALMAFVAKVTPLDTVGAAIALNVVVAFVAVLVGQRLLRRCLDDDRLVLLGTAVIALGSSAIGFGHLLMTDYAFSILVGGLVIVLLNFRERRSWGLLAAAAGLVWLGFSLRYAALYLIPVAAVWLLLVPPPEGGRRGPGRRVLEAGGFAVAAFAAPLAWMLRNRSLDGTFTGPRYSSARGIFGNAYDIVVTIGKFLLPGVANGRDRIWALVGLAVLAIATIVGIRLLLATRREGEGVVARSLRLLGGPTGLVLMMGVGYLAYMLYVRSTTALNQLDLRLLEPAYLPLMVCGLRLVDRLGVLDGAGAGAPAEGGRWAARGLLTARIWAAANIAAGLVAIVAFAAGNPYFDGNYGADEFEQVRDNPALDAIPDDCHVVSNLPNALYPVEEPEWSPRRTGLESDQRVDDLEELVPTLDSTPTCLVWIDLQPRYGHLWTLSQLRDRVELQPLATDGEVSVYRMLPATSG
ncbi:hypothetical protein [Dermatobacter hominis]|uniref:hypothetical protein n=1 Tax=Dermatobacter hominis TaxID=2884263 RepID=UPI001D11BDAD|nr:hypothetical protein [Dermatobacter hominis]UDY34634.1 hypothetical protein LH044_14980 [Dermatobacter hominis]